MLRHERKASKRGFTRIEGIDEAGRGPWAGPVVAACVILKDTEFCSRIDDSKILSKKARELAYLEISDKAIFGLGIVDEFLIDQINILEATRLAMLEAVNSIPLPPDFLIIDGNSPIDCDCEYSTVIDGID
jgi:ribonuclease HII